MTRIDSTQTQAIDTYDRHRSGRVEEDQSNDQLLVPASYAAVGGTFELLMLMMELSKEQKDGVREQRSVTDAALASAQSAQVQSIRDKAALQIGKAAASAVATLGGSAMTLAGGIDATRLDESKAKLDALEQRVGARSASLADAKQAHAALQHELGARSVWERAGGEAFGVARTLSDGGFDGAITHKDADATEHGNKAEALKRSADKLSSDLDQIEGNEGKLISYVRDIEAARTRCTQIALQSR